jgi:hypothetical protein
MPWYKQRKCPSRRGVAVLRVSSNNVDKEKEKRNVEAVAPKSLGWQRTTIRTSQRTPAKE